MNVYPREIEDVLYTHPDVLEAAVVAVPGRAAGRGGWSGRGVPARAQQSTLEDVQSPSSRTASRPTSTRATIWQVEGAPQGTDGQDPAPRGARAGRGVSASTTSPGCRPLPLASDAPSRRAPETAGGTAGLVLLGVWSALLGVGRRAVGVRAPSSPGAASTGPWPGAARRRARSCWWPWACSGGRGGRPARCARAAGRGGPSCSCSGGVAVVQAVLTSTGRARVVPIGRGRAPAARGHRARSSAACWRPSRSGWSRSTVAVLARRSWAATDAAEVPDAAPDADESTPADGGVSVPG